jgi:hypothetical protein
VLQAILDELNGKLDSLSEMAELEMLRLQQVISLRSRTMSALSNLLARMGDSASTIIANLK